VAGSSGNGGSNSGGSGHHQRSSSGNFYTSGKASDPKAGPGGRFISTGDRGGHTTHVYNGSGQHVHSKSSGDGGPAKGVSPGGKSGGSGSGGSGGSGGGGGGGSK
jgi:hypothetical protein